MFRRILIANRGEIAVRILRACRQLGIEGVAVHSEGDAGATWVRDADMAVCLGPAPASLSYLDADAVLQAAEQTECQAIHPGYGFLSENATFAARCADRGLTFVGPGPAALRLMGDKAEARRTMERLGVSVVPGTRGVVTAEQAVAAAEEVGYPVLLKAAAGGGGRGMRRCDSPGELPRAFAEASMEAEKAFGNGSLYVERFVHGGRHIEFQVLADAFGNAVHLGERECSVQRSHQKLLEESPSPVIDAGTRDAWGARVATALASTGYRGAGTVEFLRGADGALYFMEVNARLQVEHPVTEMVFGVDLVAAQIRIAARQLLPFRQADLVGRGHAIEMRINAEDPDKSFRPDPGVITSLNLAPRGPAGVTVRWDSAVEAGSRVPPQYDSMIGKLIVHAPDRAAAIEAAGSAIGALEIEGVRTTIGLHRRILAEPRFVRGDYDLDFLRSSGLVREAAARRD